MRHRTLVPRADANDEWSVVMLAGLPAAMVDLKPISTRSSKSRPRSPRTPVGFDPSLGIMHADHRYRGSLASDLMEPARPAADAMVVDLLNARALRRGDVVENREGVCRIGLPLVRELARSAPGLRAALAPHAETLARVLMADPDHPTPLTRRWHRAALAAAQLSGA